MKKQKTQSKLIVALTAVVLLLVALSATLTFAYFTASSNATSSQMQFGTLSVNASALTAGQKAATCTVSEVTHTLVPGCTIQLNGTINVSGNIDALVRAKLTAEAYKRDGVDKTTPDAGVYKVVSNKVEEVDLGETTIDAYELDTNAGEFYAVKTTVEAANGDGFAGNIFDLAKAGTVANWIYNEGDDYFYFNSIRNGTSGSANFASEFTLPAATMGNDWQDAYIQFGIDVEVIQAEHLTNDDNHIIAITKGNDMTLANATITVNGSALTGTGDANAITVADKVGAIATAKAWDAQPDGTWSE